ncbi:Zinc finger, C2H2 type family protein [Brugia malayi]|uniref:Bm9594 n=1 Tax=Brugia malayi TaxID=6279 RepID=A0A0K0JZU3_BRUMA|nr:Zinc finger, C2H2 type family protein [Brugia malayi]CDP94520.1 Bm9594 [Brugia malayi]VIO90710.1 Zinc finger, C2H2 type family protein [Brugia malayi]
MIQIIWFSFLLCIVLAKNGSISPLNLDIDDITWDDCSNGYFSTSSNILDNSNLESILGSGMDIHNNELEISAENLQNSISFHSSHFDFTDLWKNEHRSNEDSKIETVPITTGNYQLQELSRTDGENMHASISSDPLHFLDFTHFHKIEDASTEQLERKTDLVNAKNLELFVLQNPTITDEKNYVCPHVGCTMKTKNYNEYIAHRKTHPKPFIYECKVPGCGLIFNYRSSLFSHRQTHELKPECENCGRIFSYKKNYECPHVGCTMKTENYSEYIAHRRTHPKPFTYECRAPGCGRTFSNPSTLVNHQEIHGPRSHCGNCGKIFIHKKNMNYHRQCCTKVPH